MMQRQFGQHLLSLGSKGEQDFATIVLRRVRCTNPPASSRFTNSTALWWRIFHAVGQFADSRRTPAGMPLIASIIGTARAPTRPALHLLAEMEEAPDLIAELRQCLVIRQSEPFHPLIVSCPIQPALAVYRNTIYNFRRKRIPPSALRWPLFPLHLESSVPLFDSIDRRRTRLDPAL